MAAVEDVLLAFINALGESRNSEELLKALPDALSAFLKLDEVAIAYLPAANAEDFDALPLRGKKCWSGRLPLAGSAVDAAFKSRSVLTEAGIGKYSNYFDVRKLAENGLNSYAVFPLSCEGRIYATLNLASSDENAFKRARMGLLRLACDYTAKLLYALRSSERARKRSTSAAVSNAIPHIYLSLGQDFRLSFVDGNPAQLLGYSSSELEGMRLSNIVHSNDYKRLNSVLNKLAEGTPVKHVDFTFITKDGTHTRFELRGSRQGASMECVLVPPGSGGAARINELSSDAIYTMDSYGVVRTWNKAAQSLLGYSADEIIGSEARRLFEDGSTSELDEMMRGLKGGKEILTSRTNRVRKGGKPIPVLSSALAILDDDRNVVGYTELLRDLSASVRLGEAERELRRQAHKNKKLVNENEEKSKFISDVSHELRTPLTNIRGYASLLKDGEVGELNKEQREFVEIICDETVRLSKLITDVLDLSKMESRKLKMDIGTFDPRILEEQCSCDSMAQAKGLYVRWNFAPDVKEIYGDQAKIAQILINLISNAIKFTSEGGITINVKNASRTFVQFDVTDTGIGIPMEEQPKLFKRFSQLSSGVKRKGSTGLGLAITKEIVRLHSGKIWVKSEVGKGTTFSFKLRRIPPKQRKKP